MDGAAAMAISKAKDATFVLYPTSTLRAIDRVVSKRFCGSTS
jgi:hypothetical protein